MPKDKFCLCRGNGFVKFHESDTDLCVCFNISDMPGSGLPVLLVVFQEISFLLWNRIYLCCCLFFSAVISNSSHLCFSLLFVVVFFGSTNSLSHLCISPNLYENHKATKLAFNVGPSSACHLNGVSIAG